MWVQMVPTQVDNLERKLISLPLFNHSSKQLCKKMEMEALASVSLSYKGRACISIWFPSRTTLSSTHWMMLWNSGVGFPIAVT